MLEWLLLLRLLLLRLLLETFKDAAIALGMVRQSTEYIDALKEVALTRTPSRCR